MLIRKWCALLEHKSLIGVICCIRVFCSLKMSNLKMQKDSYALKIGVLCYAYYTMETPLHLLYTSLHIYAGVLYIYLAIL